MKARHKKPLKDGLLDPFTDCGPISPHNVLALLRFTGHLDVLRHVFTYL
jgi:hypothetical protein